MVLDFEFNQLLSGNVLHTRTGYKAFGTKLLESPPSASLAKSDETTCNMRVRGMV